MNEKYQLIHFPRRVRGTGFRLLSMALLSVTTLASAQDRLKTMPGYERFQRITQESSNAVTLGSLTVTWTNNGEAFYYRKDGKRFLYTIGDRKAKEVGTAGPERGGAGNRPQGEGRREGRNRPSGPTRGRQWASATSPNGKYKALYRDRNLWLSDTNGDNETPITTEGSDKSRLKFGTATWTYGEELAQTTAMWWSSNSQKIAFYRIDESHVPDYFLSLNQTHLQSSLNVEPYPKAGGTNPVVGLCIYDVSSKQTIELDVRDGKPFDDSVPGHYVYGISWSPDGKELLFHRTNRRQNILEYCAGDPETGKCRVIVREEWPASWVANSPVMRFLDDGKRFIWESERTGWRNFLLYDLSGKELVTLTAHQFEVGDIVKVDERAGLFYYTARSGDNPMKLQLHCVGLDGHGERRLTDPALNHSIDFAPDGRHFIDVSQTHDQPPTTRLMEADGKQVAELAVSDMTKFKKLGLKPVELFEFNAADDQTKLYGMLHFPSNFKPYHKYPMLVTVYAGPSTTGARETFTMPNSLTELGFLVASFDSRSASGRGKRFLDTIYLRLGTVEIDDQAAGVRFLADRRYVDKNRVGIFGTSYGGTASALCLLRYPDVFRAAASSSPVTDFRNYDTVYTERYMWVPQENSSGYDKGSLMTYAKALKGDLMLYYGTADDNVHPSNMLQFVQSLQRAGKSFEIQVGPDQGHGSMNRDRMMEFFIQHLVLK
jgi:dipeptidyl-peptidase-4